MLLLMCRFLVRYLDILFLGRCLMNILMNGLDGGEVSE